MIITIELAGVSEPVVHKNVKTIERKETFIWLSFDVDGSETMSYPWRVIDSVHMVQES